VEPQLIGRDAEVADISAFLSATSGLSAALSITGDAGIGKTMVWQNTLRVAGRSARVLSCQPTLTERPLGFSVLDDLLGDVPGEIVQALPGPRRQAVEVALLRDVSVSRSRAGRLEADRHR
jgi:hypothetical protein